jgi:hypothetical protein
MQTTITRNRALRKVALIALAVATISAARGTGSLAAGFRTHRVQSAPAVYQRPLLSGKSGIW